MGAWNDERRPRHVRRNSRPRRRICAWRAHGCRARRAQEMARTDPRFREEVARWSGRLAPLLEEVAAAAPPGSAWQKIERRIATEPAGTNVIQLRRRVNQWRGIAAAMSALAACLAIFIAVRPAPPSPVPAPIERPSAPPLLAMLGNDQQGTKVVASWDPGGAAAGACRDRRHAADPSHAHELWVIPPGGKPRSLGTMGSPNRCTWSSPTHSRSCSSRARPSPSRSSRLAVHRRARPPVRLSPPER